MAQQTEFIPYEQALELKELGFDYYNIAWYAVIDEKPRIVFLNYGGHWKTCAPLYQQSFRWFRERHNLFSSVSVDQTMEPKFCYSLSKYADPYDWVILVFNSELYYTYEEAELACLRKLIEIVKKQINYGTTNGSRMVRRRISRQFKSNHTKQ